MQRWKILDTARWDAIWSVYELFFWPVQVVKNVCYYNYLWIMLQVKDSPPLSFILHISIKDHDRQ